MYISAFLYLFYIVLRVNLFSQIHSQGHIVSCDHMCCDIYGGIWDGPPNLESKEAWPTSSLGFLPHMLVLEAWIWHLGWGWHQPSHSLVWYCPTQGWGDSRDETGNCMQKLLYYLLIFITRISSSISFIVVFYSLEFSSFFL